MGTALFSRDENEDSLSTAQFVRLGTTSSFRGGGGCMSSSPNRTKRANSAISVLVCAVYLRLAEFQTTQFTIIIHGRGQCSRCALNVVVLPATITTQAAPDAHNSPDLLKKRNLYSSRVQRVGSYSGFFVFFCPRLTHTRRKWVN